MYFKNVSTPTKIHGINISKLQVQIKNVCEFWYFAQNFLENRIFFFYKLTETMQVNAVIFESSSAQNVVNFLCPF